MYKTHDQSLFLVEQIYQKWWKSVHSGALIENGEIMRAEIIWSSYLIASILIGFVLGMIVSYAFRINDISLCKKKSKRKE